MEKAFRETPNPPEEILGFKEKLQKPYVEKKNENTIIKCKKTRGQTMIYKILYRKIKIEQREPHNQLVELTCFGRVADPVPLIAPVVLLMF